MLASLGIVANGQPGGVSAGPGPSAPDAPPPAPSAPESSAAAEDPAPLAPQAPAPVQLIDEPVLEFFSNSEVQCFKRCKRKWWLAFYRRLGLKQQPVVGARGAGNRVHFALAGWYSPTPVNPYELLASTISNDLEAYPEQADEIQKEGDLCQAMLEGYFQWVSETGADQGLEIVGSEQPVKATIVIDDETSVTYGGKLDVKILRQQDGARLFLDHKTVGNLTEPPRMLHLDEQMLTYHLLEYLEAVQSEVQAPLTDGGLYNMLRKVKRTGQAKPPFYDRVEVRHNRHELENFYVRVSGELRAMIETREVLDSGVNPQYVVYPTPRRDCTWDCDFLPICPMFDDGSNVEGLVEMLYTDIDPYQRYVNDKVEE